MGHCFVCCSSGYRPWESSPCNEYVDKVPRYSYSRKHGFIHSLHCGIWNSRTSARILHRICRSHTHSLRFATFLDPAYRSAIPVSTSGLRLEIVSHNMSLFMHDTDVSPVLSACTTRRHTITFKKFRSTTYRITDLGMHHFFCTPVIK